MVRQFIKDKGLGGKISTQQVKRKWENLTAKYKDWRKPQSGVGTEDGKATAAPWKWYSEMDGILGQKPSISPPVVISSSGQVAAVATPSSVPCTSADDTITPPPNKRRSSGAVSTQPHTNQRQKEKAKKCNTPHTDLNSRRSTNIPSDNITRVGLVQEIVMPVRCCPTRPSSNGSSQDRTCIIIPSPCLNDPLTCRTIIVIATPMVILHNVWLNKVLGMSNYPPENAHNSHACPVYHVEDRGPWDVESPRHHWIRGSMGKPIKKHVDLYWPTMVRVRPQHCNKGCDGLPRQAEISLEVSIIVVEAKDGHMQSVFSIKKEKWTSNVFFTE
ncbi:unnamed protein product [Arctogadus glacialis]